MSRTAAAIQGELLALPPMGWALPRDPDTYWGARLLAVANEWSLVEAQMESFEQELDPGTAVNLLADYQRVLGPDPYGRDLLPLTDSQKSLLMHIRWVDAPIICAGYFVSVAADIGITMTILENPLTVCGGSVCGTALVPWLQHCAFSVSLPDPSTWTAFLGVQVCGQVLGNDARSPMEAMIRDRAPLFSRPAFFYHH